MIDCGWLGVRLVLSFTVGLAGCTPEQAAPFGKLMFGMMVVFLVGIPIVFIREWRRRRKR